MAWFKKYDYGDKLAYAGFRHGPKGPPPKFIRPRLSDVKKNMDQNQNEKD